MSTKIRGYRWAMNYRGFDFYRHISKQEWIVLAGSKIDAPVYRGVGSDDVKLMNDVDAWWMVQEGR
ncbi:MAG TPA: hypothetical protein VIY48_04530 [Candidatus Paceibacterota bacterium]